MAEGDRYGIIYEARAGGRGIGVYTAVDRVLGWRTAWALEVQPWQSDRMVQGRLKAMRELWERENERWRWLTSEQQREVIRRGGGGERPAA